MISRRQLGLVMAVLLLTGCGQQEPARVVPLASTVLPSSGDAIVVLFVPGAS